MTDSLQFICIDIIYDISYAMPSVLMHLDLRYAYNHFDYLILGYKMIQTMRHAFQGLTPNGSFVYLKC